MLVLSRKIDEEILIPSLDVTVRVLCVEGGRVKVGLSAPEPVHITRPKPVESNAATAGAR